MRPTSLRALHRVPSYADVRAYLAGNGFADFRDAALPLKAGAELLIGYRYRFEPSVTTTWGSRPQFLRFLRNGRM